MIGADGHLRLTDFGLSKILTVDSDENYASAPSGRSKEPPEEDTLRLQRGVLHAFYILKYLFCIGDREDNSSMLLMQKLFPTKKVVTVACLVKHYSFFVYFRASSSSQSPAP